MAYPLLRWVLEQEGSNLRRIEKRWRPDNLLQLRQVQLLLDDIDNRYTTLVAAKRELQSLHYAERYTTIIVRMRVWVREAKMFWRLDQLAFLRAAAAFYESYGEVLYYLKREDDLGHIDDKSV